MATQLPAPITVQSGPYSASATHEQFGATIHPWADSPIVIHLAAVQVEPDGSLLPINGVRSDTDRVSPTDAHPSRAEWDALSGLVEWQTALGKAAALFRYIEADRDPALKPAWLP